MASVRDEWNREWAEHADHGLPAQPDSLLPPVVRDLTPGRALDLGCGDGQNAIVKGVVGATASVRRVLREMIKSGEVEMQKTGGRHAHWLVKDSE